MMRPPLARFHAGQGSAHGMEGGGQVDGDDLIPFLDGKFLDRRHELDAGIVDQHIHAAQLLFGGRDHGGDFLALAHIGAVINRLDAEILFDGGAFLLNRVLVAEAVDHHMRTVLRIDAGDGQADARG